MKTFALILLLGVYCTPGFSQISGGGSPIEFPELKNQLKNSLVDLPKLDNEKLREASILSSRESTRKPLHFAQPIHVDLDLSNSGKWTEYEGYKIWTLGIRSEGAKSLNIIFDDFHLPGGSRLFIYSSDKKTIKGAFGAHNNKPGRILATEPVYGDHIVLQYEEPLNSEFSGSLSVGSVNHDFLGIVKNRENTQHYVSGACNVNINCDYLDSYKYLANAVSRYIIDGSFYCTGSLINNTGNDKKPYFYSAGHCIESDNQAQNSVFIFNYESPYCNNIEGDKSHSVSGSSLKSRSDDLDFVLLELSSSPPNKYRPYFMGWDRREILPDSSITIHHPDADIKKISIDRNSPTIDTYDSDHVANAFFLIGKWEVGTTEAGSSGSALINPNGQIIGSLTGGVASCDNSIEDYFARFSFAWDYHSEDSRSMKNWLDPSGTGKTTIDGIYGYEGSELCGAFTNFKDDDTHAILEIDNSGGYWAGTNTQGYKIFAERFERSSSSEVQGVSLGIAKALNTSLSSDSKIKIQVYSGSSTPETLLYEQEYELSGATAAAMNYYEFTSAVSVSATFFVAISIEKIDSEDTMAAYLAKRENDTSNSFYINDGNNWNSYPEKSGGTNGSALLMELVLCNINQSVDVSELSISTFEAFPNPLYSGQSTLHIRFKDEVIIENIKIYNLAGQLVYSDLTNSSPTKSLEMDFNGFINGTYFLKVYTEKDIYETKVLYLAN